MVLCHRRKETLSLMLGHPVFSAGCFSARAHTMATLYKLDGAIEEVAPENGTDFQLEELHEMLECRTIEVVYLRDGNLIIIDEEGKMFDKPVNVPATNRVLHDLLPGDYIAGNMLLCSQDQLR